MTLLSTWWEIVLTVVKISGIVMTAIFASYGIAHEYKKDGVLTREGKIAIWGTFLSAVLSLGSQAIESAHQFRSEREQAAAYTKELENWNTILSDVRRGLYPVSDFHVEARMQISLSSPYMRTYAERLRHEITTRQNGYDKHGFSKSSFRTGVAGWVSSESTAYPQPDKEHSASIAITSINMYLFFSKGPIEGGSFHFDPINDSDGWFRALLDPKDPPVIYFDSRCPDTVELHLKLPKLELHMNEKAKYLGDFSNAELLVQPETWINLERALSPSEVSMEQLALSFGSRDHVVLQGLLRHVEILSQPYFEYKLPAVMVGAGTVLSDTSPQLPKAESLCPSLDAQWPT